MAESQETAPCPACSDSFKEGQVCSVSWPAHASEWTGHFGLPAIHQSSQPKGRVMLLLVHGTIFLVHTQLPCERIEHQAAAARSSSTDLSARPVPAALQSRSRSLRESHWLCWLMQNGGSRPEEVQLRVSLEEEREAVLNFLYTIIDLVRRQEKTS